jgi:hypothetical protein
MGGRSRKRLPAAIAALVVVALGLATALWLTSGDTADPATDDTEVASTPLVTAAPDTTEPALTLPTTPPSTEAPATTAAPAPTTVLPTPTPGVPPGSIVVTDPAGWTMSMDPSWTESTQNGVRNWFTNTGSDTFDDNINVTVEALTAPISLDDYLAAAKSGILATAPDFQLVDERRFLSPDGVELVLLSWSATLPNLPLLSFLQTLTVTPTNAYVATFTSETDRMPQIAALFEPYLLTLRGAS